MSYYKQSKDPKRITAKFDCVCKETGKQIKKGDTCYYYPNSKEVFHVDSNQAYDFCVWQQDLKELNQNY